MANSDRRVTIEIEVDDQGAVNALRKVEDSTSQVEAAAKSAGTAVAGMEQGIRQAGAASVEADPKIKALHDDIAKLRNEAQALAQQAKETEAQTRRLGETAGGQGGGSAADLFGKLARSVAGYVTIQKTLQFARETLEWADALDETSQALGLTATSLQGLQYAAEQSGTPMNSLVKALQTMEDRIGGNDATIIRGLQRLGIGFSDVKSLAPDALLVRVADAWKQTSDETIKAAAGADIFGGSWRQLSKMLVSDIETLKTEAPKLADAQIKELGRINDAWERLTRQAKIYAGQAMLAAMWTAGATKGTAPGTSASFAAGMYVADMFLPWTPNAPASPYSAGGRVSVPGLGPAEEKQLEEAAREHLASVKKAAADAERGHEYYLKWLEALNDTADIQRRFAAIEAHKLLIAADPSLMAILPSNWSYGSSLQRSLRGAGVIAPGVTGGQGGIYGKGEYAGWSWGNTGQAFNGLGGNILQAIMGGGSVGKTIGSSLLGGLGADAGSWVKGLFSKGSFLGKTLGGFLGPLGSIVGSGLGSLVDSLFGKSEGWKKDRQAESDQSALQSQLLAQYGSLDQIKNMGAAGAELVAAWYSKGAAGFDWFKQKVDAFKQSLDLKSEIDALNGQLDALKKQQVPTWDQVKAAADRYGLTLAGMGQKFQQLSITETATQILNDWNTLTAGMDANAVANAMSKQLQQLVLDARKYGVTLPENMKPALQALIDQGLLLDENGQKITDLSGVKFGPAVKTQADIIKDAMAEVVKKLDELVTKLASLNGTTTTTTVVVNEERRTKRDAGDLSDEGNVGNPDYAARGGYVTASGVQYFGPGGVVLPFRPRGTDTVPAMLTPGEGVLSRRGMAALGALNREQAGRMRQTLIVQLDRRTLAEAVMEDMPAQAKVRVG